MSASEQHEANDETTAPQNAPSVANVPLLVHAGAAIMPIIALGLAILLGVLSAIIGRELSSFGVGPAVASMLLGQGLTGRVGILLLGDVSASVALVPFGVILPVAFLLDRIGFTSPWLRVKHARFLPAAVGGVAAIVIGFLLSLISESGIRSSVLLIAFDASPRPLWAFVAGAAPWLLAVLIANFPAARRILLGLLALEALLVLGVVVLTGYAGLESGIGLGSTLVAMLGMLIVTLAVSANVVAALVVLPLGGALGARTSESSFSIGFYELFLDRPDTPVLVLLLIVAIGSVILSALRAGTPSDLRDALLKARTFLLAATVAILPILLLGRLYGDFGAGLLDAFVGGFLGGSFGVGVGSSGQPLRWILIALFAGIIHVATSVVLARRAGLSWASDQNLSAAGQGVVAETSSRFKGAAERARQAAEAAKAAGQSAATPPTQDTEPARTDDAEESR